MTTPGQPNRPNPPRAATAKPVPRKAPPVTPRRVEPRAVPAPVTPPPAEPSVFVQVQSSPTTTTRAPARRAKSNSMPLMLSVGALVAVVAVGGVFWSMQQPKATADAKKPNKKATNAEVTPAPAVKPAEVKPVVPARRNEPVPMDIQSTPAPTSRAPAFVPPQPAPRPTPAVTEPAQPIDETPAPTVVASVDPPAPRIIKSQPNPNNPSPSAVPSPSPEFKPPTQAEEEAFQDSLVALYRDKKLLVKKEYPGLRTAFANRFARLHGDKLKQGYGADAEAMQTWLDEHPEIRDEFYLAIRPERDNLTVVGQIFNELRKQFPDKLVPYSELAIATAVVWDQPNGVYEYKWHAQRCKATMPANLLTAVENFKYYVSAESQMEGRIRYVPWEFLKHVINHRTPEQERVWAMQNFAVKRVMYGKCYSDVPYDYEMLNSQSKTAKLNDKEYSLPNLLQFGGVCAMQADFAARTGKAVGISAEYVRGESAGGDLHAWVMWVELKQATPTGLTFTLESHGRYFGDKYYVGLLNDPQTGLEITDRDLELRLQTVGLDMVAKRHSELVMEALPLICLREELSVSDRLKFLGQTITYCPGNEKAWSAAAQLVRESSQDKQSGKLVQAVLDRLFVTFARVPDFTWKVFADLAAYYPEGKARNAMYERLIQVYEAAERPDLACEARLVWADMLAAQEKKGDAIQGLAATIKRFPSEGRYVPKMLDKLEALCVNLKDSDRQLTAFYTEILPLVPQMRGNSPSPFAITMFRRAASVFTRLNQSALAQAAQAEVEKLQARGGKS